ncbi:trypco2 family protein [Pseudovibrio sp. Ad37]|uniref:trypco2 family protein n=1 Tax=Pseudovibrio sp. Ad37 TaxID=989422 RepID=UPI0007AE4AF8|nr:trypco2 family protein [Pseudovibrio sp. Ad37]KZL25511.1 hypothetical protein PsAD37_02280 [Pseudovibrio sp. Ad37]
MQLEEFVKQTLLDITNGVAAVQNEALLYVAPGFVENERKTEPQFVKFEVVVTVNQEAGGGIKVWSLGDAKANLSSEKTNRITFDVPVYFQAPTDRNPKHFSNQENKNK